MNDPLIARFAEACGATGPLNLRVGLVDGGVLTEGTLQQPFTLIGRDDACDVTLTDPDVNPRHAWLQVIDGRVYAIDLGSRHGLIWPDGRSRSGWLDGASSVRLGPFHVALRAPVSNQPGSPGPDPVLNNPDLFSTRPAVQLDFRNGKRAKDRWTINRAITLIGRADGCKLHLNAEDISGFHCGLVLTTTGLWVVDLSGRGVVVNGERMRVAPLPHGAELWVGRFLIGCHYPAEASKRSTNDKAGAPSKANLNGPATLPTSIHPMIAEDEVQLGGLPGHDPASGLPSSHILCDAFRLPPPSGPISAPIFVSTTAAAQQNPRPAAVRNTPPRPMPGLPVIPAIPTPTDDPCVAPLLKQLSELHAQMFEQFQQSLVLMAKLFSRVPIADPAEMQEELTRIQELNGELGRLQAEVTRQSLGQTAEVTSTVSDAIPHHGAVPLAARQRTPGASDAIQIYVEERIGALQKERSHRWEKLSEIASGSSTTHKPLR